MSTTPILPKKTPSRFFLRLTLWLIGLLLALTLIVPLSAVFFLDPNDYRPQISAFLTEKTGIPIEIEGKIKLKLFPWIGLKVENTTLNQAPEFGKGKFIRIKELDLQFPVRQLLQRHLQIETLKLKGVSINYIKKSNGKTNADYFNAQAQEQKNHSQKTTTSESSSKKLTFHIANVDIEDAKIRYQDQAKNQTITLSNVQLKVENPKHLDNFPIKAQFDFSYKTKNTAAITGNGNIQGKFRPSKENLMANIQTSFSVQQADSLWKEAKIRALVDANPQMITVKNIDLKTLNTLLTGQCQIPMDKKLPVEFQLNANEINLDALFKPSNTTAPAAPSSIPSESKSTAAAKETRVVKGNIAIGKLQAKKLHLQNIKTNLVLKNERVVLHPLSANLYDGKLNAQVHYPLNAIPGSFQGKISGIQLQPLLKDLGHQIPLSGVADFDFNLMQTNLIPQGSIKCTIKNGVIHGADVKYYLNKVQAKLKKEKLTLPDTQQTPFSSLTATLFTHDNMIDNNDLLILSPDFRVNGVGSVNLNDDTLAYKLQAWRQYPDGTEHPNAYPLAIRLKGSLQHPRVEPDFDLYLKTVFEKEMKERLNINKHLEKGLDKLLGGKTEESSESASKENDIQHKLEHEIGKGLKKLFRAH